MQLCTLLLFPFLKTGTLPIAWYNTIVKTYETVGTVDTHDDHQTGGSLFPDGINPLMERNACHDVYLDRLWTNRNVRPFLVNISLITVLAAAHVIVNCRCCSRTGMSSADHRRSHSTHRSRRRTPIAGRAGDI